MPKEDVTVTVTYTINQYTVTFVDFDGSILGTSTVDYGTSAVAPADPIRENYTFIGWNKKFNEVVDNMIVTAMYEANLLSIYAKEKSNAQLQFQVGSTDDIKNYIDVYKVYADETEVLATNDEYTTDFTTEKVVTDKILTITLNGLTDNSLNYDITERPAYPTKFEVVYNPNKSYQQTKKDYCTNNCDSTENTKTVTTDYTFLEIIEHYDENISISSVKANYTNGQNENLYVSDSVRWTHKEEGAKYDPVYITTRTTGIWDTKVDVMTDNLIISTLEITYNRTGYGKYTIVFQYDSTTQIFKAVSEMKV